MDSRSSSRSDGYNWSKWEWDGRKGKFYRYRYNSKNKQVWESREGVVESTPRVPIPTTSSAISRFSSSANDNSPQYSEANDYSYNAPTQASDPVGGITQALAESSLTQGQASTADEYVDNSSSGQSSSVYQVPIAQYQATRFQAPRPAYGQSSSMYERSMYSAQDRMQNYTSTTGSNFSSAPINYNPAPPSSSFYNPRAPPPPEEDEEELYYSDEEPAPYEQQLSTSSQSGAGRDSSPGRSYETDATVTQASVRARARSRRPPPPLQVSSEVARIPQEFTRPNITGTAGKYESLDPSFKVHRSKYFKPGQIFKVVWAEPKGEPRSDTASISEQTDVTVEGWTADGEYGQKVYSSVRRFVVVATGNGFSNCVPILTYGRQGLGKRGITPEYHAIIYSTPEPPVLNFVPHLKPIQFEGRNARHKLEPMSLVNYAKIYPVEHNVKVQFIGWVAKDSQRHFVRDSNGVWNSLRQM